MKLLQALLFAIAAQCCAAFRSPLILQLQQPRILKRPMSALRMANTKPPSTLKEMMQGMQQAVVAALDDGYQMLEIQAPAVPKRRFQDLSGVFSPHSVNIALAAELGQHIAENTKYKNVTVFHRGIVETVTLPKTKWKWPLVKERDERIDNDTQLVICCSRELEDLFEMEKWLDAGFVMPYSNLTLDTVMAGNFTYNNLTDYFEATKDIITSERRLILFNMDLDDVRDHLFKNRDFQYRFLSRAYAAYLMAPYHVAASTDNHPFYTLQARGVLMRQHPSQFEYYLDHGQEQYSLIKSYKGRPVRLPLHRHLLSNIGAQDVRDVNTVKERLSWWEKPTQFNLHREVSKFWRL